MSRHHRKSSEGPSQRQLRVGELVRRTIADLLMRGEIHDPDLAGAVITITEVRTSPDLKHATVFFAPLGADAAAMAAAGRALKRAAGQIRTRLAREIRLKYAIELHFQPDTSFETASHIDEILRSEKVRRDTGDHGGPQDARDGDD
ncbi:MAG: 30S ribosome-binding factor RbfA [Alphaproteobacteria bacterium]|nr:30S ribosome-binding factor RbfA [Alphaproteobacteria bacterium]MDX5368549.1 30S ribosome-binding factor RbfA [Alphaproteobacteria bacterium]MDX5463305.1 30S ribosome-binding factor RbfA [Alphaproteobacteria bacterium]